ncbi:hypothetical protein ACFFJT_10645 [Dyella flava]|uniref:Uncharacterized protein n=1 Tax=Dyella flava TaxID=1920170 RepID=A0ABS2JZK3_9GAMM|nr:hypothetical protein [Dyella flava]MBM7123897.1 hypothetical protein [Dyella flava]GLQ52575.1 hypothetical protein GCM10010872_40240 [Dyella flava]
MTYKQPPLNRGVDPMRMNWLWRLTCEVGYVTVKDAVAALEQAGIQVSHERALGWLKGDGEEGYYPLTIAELEQNLRALRSVRLDLFHKGLNDSPNKRP